VGIARWLVVTLLLGGCRVDDSAAPDATADAGDLLTDSGEDGADAAPDAAPQPCDLLAAGGCGSGTSCYPFPFREMATGETGCAAYQPLEGRSPQCDAHFQCPGGSVCATLFALGTDCHRLCDVNVPTCAHGMECIPLAGYPRAGLCL
jgi:hypothetical protein